MGAPGSAGSRFFANELLNVTALYMFFPPLAVDQGDPLRLKLISPSHMPAHNGFNDSIERPRAEGISSRIGTTFPYHLSSRSAARSLPDTE